MKRLFINYRTEDTRPTALHLLNELNKRLAPEQVFLDVDGIQGGQEWPKRLQDELQTADVVFALIGKHWLAARNPDTQQRCLDEPGDWVRRELEVALGREAQGELLLLPVLVDDAKRPGKADLPGSLEKLPSLQVEELRNDKDWTRDVEALLEILIGRGLQAMETLQKLAEPDPKVEDPVAPLHRRTPVSLPKDSGTRGRFSQFVGENWKWILFGLGTLFVVSNIVYNVWSEPHYLRTPQEMTLETYLKDTQHRRPGFFLIRPPASLEVIITDLVVMHVDSECILLVEAANGSGSNESQASVPARSILIQREAGRTADLTVSAAVALQTQSLKNTQLGFIPDAPIVIDDVLAEKLHLGDLRSLEHWKILLLSGGGEAKIGASGPYRILGEGQFTNVAPEATNAKRLSDGPEDFAKSRGADEIVALNGGRLISREFSSQDGSYFIIGDALESPDRSEVGRWAAVLFDRERYSEWLWALGF